MIKIVIKCLTFFFFNARDDAVAIERIAHEFCEDQAASGVLYCEVRYCPHLLCTTEDGEMNRTLDEPANKKPNMLIKKVIKPRAVVEAVSRGLKRGERDFGVKARSILCCVREKPGKELHTYLEPTTNEAILDARRGEINGSSRTSQAYHSLFVWWAVHL